MYRDATYAALALLVVAYATVPAAAGTAAEQRAEGADALHAKDYERAVTALEALVETAPDDTDAWVSLGMARSGLNEWDSALKAYERAYYLNAGNFRLLNNMGNYYATLGQREIQRGESGRANLHKARQYFQQALRLSPGYAASRHGLEIIDQLLGR